MAGPGDRYALGPSAPAAHAPPTEGELPEAYGTERLFLTARDPRCLYAAWDLTSAQHRRYEALSREGHLVLRVQADSPVGPALREIPISPESKSCFLEVPAGGARYVAEVGYYNADAQWTGVARSEPALTPPEARSPDITLELATVPPDARLPEIVQAVLQAGEATPTEPAVKEESPAEPQLPGPEPAPAPAVAATPEEHVAIETGPVQTQRPIPSGPGLLRQAVSDQVPLLEAVQQLRAEGWSDFPELKVRPGPEMSEVQARALAEAVWPEAMRPVAAGSIEVSQWVGGPGAEQISSAALAEAPGKGAEWAGVSSPAGAGERGEGRFWMNVNAELVIYGATEPNARVTIEGRAIRLRRDGTFSYRFALPDGQYSLLINALSPDGTERRGTTLRFARKTEHEGEVGVHPQEASLRAPDQTQFV